MSFELAEKRLSADVSNFSASSSSLKKGETFRDTVQNIQVMKVDCIVMRHPSPGSSLKLTKFVDSINKRRKNKLDKSHLAKVGRGIRTHHKGWTASLIGGLAQ